MTPSTSAVWRAEATSTLIPHTGSTAVAALAARTTGAPAGAVAACARRRVGLDDFGEDRQRDFRRGPRAEIEPCRTPDRRRRRARPVPRAARARPPRACARRRARRRARRHLRIDLERLLVVVPLRRDDGGAQSAAGRPADIASSASSGSDRHAERRGFLLDVALLAAIDDAHDVVVHAARQPRQRTRQPASRRQRRAVAPGRTARRRRRWRLPRRRSSGRRHARRSSARLARVRPNRHQAAARAASASSACCRMISREQAPPTKPSMRPSAKTIARSPRCADTGRAPRHDGGNGERLPFAPQRRNLFEEVHSDHAESHAFSDRGARASAPPARCSGSSRPASCPWNSTATSRAARTSRPHSFSNRLFNSANVSSSRHSASFASRSRYPHWKRSSGRLALQELRQQRPIRLERDHRFVANGRPEFGREVFSRSSGTSWSGTIANSSRWKSALAFWNRMNCGLR